VKDSFFVPPLPANLMNLCNRITAAVALVNCDMLTRVWDEMDYCIDDTSAKVDTLSISELYNRNLGEFISIL
jgi:hypothetical protein